MILLVTYQCNKVWPLFKGGYYTRVATTKDVATIQGVATIKGAASNQSTVIGGIFN